MPEVTCVRCGQRREAIQGVPYGGKIGAELKAKICDPCWKEWYAQSIKIINEYHLSLRDAKSRDFLATQMKIFLKLAPPPEGHQTIQLDDVPPSAGAD